MSNTLALVDGEKTGSLVVAPQTFGEVVQFAEMMAKCTFVPKHLRGQPANCMAVCLQALRWSMDPFSVAQKTYFTNEGSAPGYEAQLINAVILSRAPLEGRLKVEWSGDNGALTCTVTGKFKGDPDPKKKTCRLANITVKNSPLWKSDPEQQLAYYTTRAWARLYCPDVVMGIYTPDELSEPAIGPDAAVDVTPPRAASRLDALEETITGEDGPPARTPAVDPGPADGNSTKGSDPSAPETNGSGGGAPSFWDAGEVEKTQRFRIPLMAPESGETRYFADVPSWCQAFCELVDGLDPWGVWEANQETHATLAKSIKNETMQGHLKAAADYAFAASKPPILGGAG